MLKRTRNIEGIAARDSYSVRVNVASCLFMRVGQSLEKFLLQLHTTIVKNIPSPSSDSLRVLRYVPFLFFLQFFVCVCCKNY